MTAPTRPCPFCGKTVLVEETLCWNCGRELPPAERDEKQERVIEALSALAKRRMDYITEYRMRAEAERRQRQTGGLLGGLRRAVTPARVLPEGEDAWVEQQMRADPQVADQVALLAGHGVDAAPMITGKKP